MVFKRLTKLVCGFAVAVSVFFPATGLIGLTSTGYQQEMAKIEAMRSELTDDPDGLKNVYFYFLKSALTGRLDDQKKTNAAFGKALAANDQSADLYLLHAAFNLKQHRLDAAKKDLERLAFMDEDPRVQVLHADIAVQEGRDNAAAVSYRSIIEKKRTWDNLSRLAYLTAKSGNIEQADRLYQEAEQEITAKDMRAYAWVELQRGYLMLGRGRYDEAWEHYQQADWTYSGYWLTQDYMAEWMAVRRKFDESIALYKQIIVCTQRPEFYQALGDVYGYSGKPGLAQAWHDKALALYLESAQRGEVQYFHQLAAFYADARLDGANAVKWAQKDAQLRPNTATYDALAWALFRDGNYLAAMDAMKKALSGNWQDAHLFFHAAMIYLAAGRLDEGKSYLQNAAAINPHYDGFHVHR